VAIQKAIGFGRDGERQANTPRSSEPKGVLVIWEQIFVPLAASFCIIVFGVKLHAVGKERGYMTVQDYLADRFESPRALRGLSAVSGIIVSLVYLVGQYTAISIVLVWLFGIPHWEALLISGLSSPPTRLSGGSTPYPGRP